jgi:hypothetical protein
LPNEYLDIKVLLNDLYEKLTFIYNEIITFENDKKMIKLINKIFENAIAEIGIETNSINSNGSKIYNLEYKSIFDIINEHYNEETKRYY